MVLPTNILPKPQSRMYANQLAESIGRNQWILILSASIAIAYLTGQKYLGVDRDFYNYLELYNSTKGDITYLETRFEIGFIYYNWFMNNVLRLSFNNFIFFSAFISIFIKFFLITRYTNQVFIGIACYLLMFYPIHEYTQIRISLAAAFSFYAFHKFAEKKLLVGAIIYLVSISFHSSTLVALPCILFFLGSKHSILKRSIIPFFIIVLILQNEIIDVAFDISIILNPLTESYLSRADYVEKLNLFSAVNLASYIVIIYGFIYKWHMHDDYSYLYFILICCGVMAAMLFYNQPVFSSRLKEYLSITLIFYAGHVRERWSDHIPQIVFLSAAAWSFSRYLQDGIISL